MKKQTALWTTKEGHKIRICDMSDTHLLNTIAFLENKAKEFFTGELSAAYLCLGFLQGEMARDACERDIQFMETVGDDPSKVCHIFDKLKTEARRRNLI